MTNHVSAVAQTNLWIIVKHEPAKYMIQYLKAYRFALFPHKSAVSRIAIFAECTASRIQ